MGKRVVLAYSGGLDTSVIVRWLADRGFEVITYTADVGQGEELGEIEEKAKKAGAVEAIIDDIKEEFAREYCLPLMRAGALYEGKYPLLSALSRPLIAKKLVEVAHQKGADYVAHGSTGKGNDQVRFEASVWALDPDIEVLAPVREWEFKSRDEEIEYAKKHGIPVIATKEKPYSYDRNLWGVAIEAGPLEDPYTEPPEDAFVITRSPLEAPDEPEYVEIEFEEGTPVAINGKRYNELWKLIWDLNEIAGKHGYGRVDMVENRLVGIKSREVYESPAGLLLIRAYDELESLVLDRFTYHYKQSHIKHPYAEVVYEALWFTPLREALDAFNNSIAPLVTGKVKFKLFKGSANIVGRISPNSLYIEDLATYSPKDSFDHKAGAAFTKVWSLPLKVMGRVRKERRK
ncbi:Argininosuccinate synthase [Desulfurobacterium thermolithotrophum DSM 11699]|uniref:Argininosuccinate synthase n=1 Tax=Desulfurobacterium thermolithotrophum (strain DSM 11699 / BSA) TaxID=868864 RepID=F0S4A2_DESTD|nr:argininosuccinate synthase [Desulfurobacterium thermolithotrophum]ADY73674.1 Argininosuccinate synthase [Desulfurobacterium thermolithotrophum DSM 11699]